MTRALKACPSDQIVPARIPVPPLEFSTYTMGAAILLAQQSPT